jgi:hypothetical protein
MARSRGRETGFNWIAGGAAAAVMVPALSLGLGAPFIVALGVAVLAGGGIVLALSPRSPLDGFTGNAMARAKVELATELLAEARPIAERLEDTGANLKSRTVGERVRHLAAVANRILAGLEADPLKVDRVRRFLTYYLPRAAEMADAYARLETRANPDTERIDLTRAIIERLDDAFTRYADNLVDADLDGLDVELKLLRQSLDEDLGQQPAVASSARPEGAPLVAAKRSR